MTRRILLFVVACALAGVGGVGGSILGHFLGHKGVIAGGVLGGILGSVGAAAVARARGWIASDRFMATALGASGGFLAAAAIATHTLGSPVGPILSTLLVGIGAVLGAGRHRDHVG